MSSAKTRVIRDQSWLISDFRVVRYHYTGHMVYVAQLAECLIVVQEVMGSTPIIHTKDDRKCRMINVERRNTRVHTKDK